MITVSIFYGSLVFFGIASLVRLVGFLRVPVHLRWEIYRNDPVYRPLKMSEPSSYRSKKFTRAFTDILFLRGYFRQRPGLWLIFYTFHLGVYLLFLWHIWIFVSPLTGVQVNQQYVLILGHTATAMAFTGGTGILLWRIFDKKTGFHYSAFHYAKWLLILALLVQGFLVVYGYFGNSITEVLAYVDKQLSFDWSYKLNSPLEMSLHVLMASVLLIYLPFGHLARLFFRYYHELRWDFVPNIDSSVQRTVSRNLARPVGWAAGHIGPGHTWTDVVVGSLNSSRYNKHE